MAFTYDLNHSDATLQATSRVRLEIGDTAQGSGPLPDGRNLQDAELAYFLEQEASNVKRAAAAALESLANAWTMLAGFHKLGPESEESRQAEMFSARAAALRATHGFTRDDTAAAAQGAFVAAVRVR